jgi:hypothetical protein
MQDLGFEIMSTIYAYDDIGFDHYEAARYLAYTQLGYPKLNTSNIKEYLTSDPNLYTYLFTASPDVGFDDSISRIEKWVKYHANTTMLINGGNDPFSARQFAQRQTNHGDNYRFTVPNGNGYSNIFSLPEEARITAETVLARWLGLPAPVTAAKVQPQASNKMPHNTLKVTRQDQ